jgi:hypothetical protein
MMRLLEVAGQVLFCVAAFALYHWLRGNGLPRSGRPRPYDPARDRRPRRR